MRPVLDLRVYLVTDTRLCGKRGVLATVAAALAGGVTAVQVLSLIHIFLRVPESKTVKNRLHIDLAPEDRDAAVERLKQLGARPVDVGQGPDVSWVVLADPEGNEFCVLSARQGGV